MYYFIWFWTKVISRAFYIIRNRKKETKRAYNLIREIEAKFNGRFSPETRKKIAVSYGIYLPMVCEAFTRLHGRLTTEREKERFIYYFVCSSLFDDFTDYHLLTIEQLFNLSFNYESYIPQTFNEEVFLYAHHFLRDFVKDKKHYDDISRKLYDAQTRSLQQHKSTLTTEEIKDITFRKGGFSVLLCYFYTDFDTGAAERSCWYQLGILIQLTNDLYDIYKDLKDGISTLPNTMNNSFELEHLFIGEIRKMKEHINRMSFSSKCKRDFSLSMAGIYAFGLIAIHQLKKLQGNAKTLPNLSTITRKKLIIDMEKISNLALWFKFTYRYAKLFPVFPKDL